MLAPGGALARRGLAALDRHQQVALEPQAIVPAQGAAQQDQVGRAVEAVAHQHRSRPGRQPRRDQPHQPFLLGEADAAAGLPDPPRQRQGPSPDPQAEHEHLVVRRRPGLVEDQHEPLARGRRTAEQLPGVGRHHRVHLQARVGQQALDPLVAHVEPLGPPRQCRRQVHQVGAARLQHRRHQQAELGALGLPLPR